MYYAGIFSAFSHRTTWTLVYYAGIVSVSHTTLTGHWCIMLVYFQYSHTAVTGRWCVLLVYFQHSHHTNWMYAGKQRCLVFVAVDIEVYFAVYFNCISMFQSAKLLSRVWLVQTLDIDVPLKCM